MEDGMQKKLVEDLNKEKSEDVEKRLVWPVVSLGLVGLVIMVVGVCLVLGERKKNEVVVETVGGVVQTSGENEEGVVINVGSGEVRVGVVVDTNQKYCFDDKSAIVCGSSYWGQDAEYEGVQPRYTDNGDGTVTDENTGLVWVKEAGEKMSYSQAVARVKTYKLAGYSDWRVPTIKELYSLMDFSGRDVDPTASTADSPFIDDEVFGFLYGDTGAGDRIIDSQWITSSVYTGTVFGNQECFFGVNFADGRIKCYPTVNNRNNGYFVRYVRGVEYGENEFELVGSGMVVDNSSGLSWQQADSGGGMDWGEALEYCEALELGGESDWRLPNAKELEYIVDYSRSPERSNSAAMDPVFEVTSIVNEAGQRDYPFYWTSTTHVSANGGETAVYVAFGRALGKMNGQIMDVHGAGAQRSDPKSGDISEYPQYFGPQGDVRRLHNFVRCVRGGGVEASKGEDPSRFSVGAGESGGLGESRESGTVPSGQQSPSEAVNACVGKVEGVECTFLVPQGKVEGVCRGIPGGQKACVPN